MLKEFLIDSNGKLHNLKPTPENNDAEKILEHVGGMGLTGNNRNTFKLIPITSFFIKVDTGRFKDLDNLMQEMTEADKNIGIALLADSLHKNFRGVLTCGDHLSIKDLEMIWR